jgi:uncharacterized protein (DUF1330 family)
MSAYIVAEITSVSDPSILAEYVSTVGAIVERFGGRYVTRAGKAERLEGESGPGRVVILEFPTWEEARAMYDSEEYAYPKSLRRRATTSRVFITEGCK